MTGYKVFIYEKDKPLLIVGFGNPLLRDDGAGTQTIKRVSKLTLPPNITILDGGSRGIDLVFLMEEYEQIIVVDAVMISRKENNATKTKENLSNQQGIIEFEIDNLVFKDDSPLSLHNLNITSTINLMQSLKMPIPRLIFLGIRAVNINYGMSLTDNVKRDIDLAIDRIKQIIEVRQ